MGIESFAWIGFAAFFVASLTVGLRLIGLWRRNRELPELLIGIGVLGIGPIGFGLITVGQLLQAGSPGAATAVFALGTLAASAGAFAKYYFNYAVYHQGSRGARAVVWFGGLGLLACYIGTGFENGFAAVDQIDVTYFCRSLLQIGCLLWGSLEALRYWRKLGRRMRVGLADPVVANRFLLWGIGAGAAGLGTAVGFTAQLISGLPPLQVPWVTLSSSMHGLVAAIAMWLAFLPPDAYRRLIERRGAPAAA